MDAGDVILAGGERLDGLGGLFAQLRGPLGQRLWVRQPRFRRSLGFRGRPADRRLVSLMVRLRPLNRRLATVEALPAECQQFTRPGDGLKHALVDVFNGGAEDPAAFIEVTFAFVGPRFAFVGTGVALVS